MLGDFLPADKCDDWQGDCQPLGNNSASQDHERDTRDLRFLARIDQGWPVKRAAKEAGFSMSTAFKLLRETKG